MSSDDTFVNHSHSFFGCSGGGGAETQNFLKLVPFGIEPDFLLLVHPFSDVKNYP